MRISKKTYTASAEGNKREAFWSLRKSKRSYLFGLGPYNMRQQCMVLPTMELERDLTGDFISIKKWPITTSHMNSPKGLTLI